MGKNANNSMNFDCTKLKFDNIPNIIIIKVIKSLIPIFMWKMSWSGLPIGQNSTNLEQKLVSLTFG